MSDVDRTVAHDRLVSRGRAEDTFERADNHVELIGPIVAAMRQDGYI